MISLIELLY